jgi:hypothetical protein
MPTLPPCALDDDEQPPSLGDLLEASLTQRPPRGFREQADGTLVCPHRDLYVCDTCATSSPGIVEVMGVHYWIPDPAERAELAAMRADRLTSDID